ncbi:TSL-kinase interacting protein 1 [Apostasia shenzhenica]|uniref:TSL-kinase interacting protein 1 n=1 Tax=Apostasia shenzhenica TaxID=1088818 RepID=A0A2H9ZX91_9ASPA|nr:TSL-kinase interacting protein 1 [Apostasia shenzhenica]
MNPPSQVALRSQAPLSESSPIYDTNNSFQMPSSMAMDDRKPGPKRTRQWAAWTRQEQENFFNALRQVGKNFEKITCRVQSKNKNQVRHYYYRLVRRMNKLLSPGFCLDAKNSKDTNAAMLRWWSLLEKYSCTPSKLHRKPRRFKIFVEALENQLLRDRNKARRKRQCQGQGRLETSSATSLLSRLSEHDICGMKALDADAENIPKGASLKRTMNSNVNFSKGIFSALKATGQKQRAGLLESAAYKRWEKAAIAGVSLVADAAEQLERVTNRVCPIPTGETVMLTRDKLKLQLFPVNDDTRRRLERDGHNPFLELTLSARKRISSVLEHLNRKWGITNVASGELILLPYNPEQDDIAKCQRWSIKDANTTAADVLAAIGSPLFRLRYGLLSEAVSTVGSSELPVAFGFEENIHRDFDANDRMAIDSDTSKTTRPNSTDMSCADVPSSAICGTVEPVTKTKDLPMSFAVSYSGTIEKTEVFETSKKNSGSNFLEADPAVKSSSALLDGEWADSLTNVSVGDLLLEASEVSSPEQNVPCMQQTPISCDSFDAAVAAHSSYHRFSSLESQPPISSIWNAEETCDEFSFRKAPALKSNGLNLTTHSSERSLRDDIHMNAANSMDYLEDPKEPGPSHPSGDEPESANDSTLHNKHDASRDVSLTDFYWPDSLGSLGQLDLDSPFSKFQQDLCFADSTSQSSFNRMLSGSLDIFHNGSALGSDKKDDKLIQIVD